MPETGHNQSLLLEAGKSIATAPHPGSAGEVSRLHFQAGGWLVHAVLSSLSAAASFSLGFAAQL